MIGSNIIQSPSTESSLGSRIDLHQLKHYKTKEDESSSDKMRWVGTLKSTNKPRDGSAQSHAEKVKRSHPSEVDHYSELRDWVQHVILEAEKIEDFKRKIFETGHCSSKFELRGE